MEAEEYKKTLAQLEIELLEITQQKMAKSMEIANHKSEFCRALREQYAAFIGKKCRIRFSFVGWKKETKYKDVIGYLRGFSFGNCYSPGEIYPAVSKCKKDGSESKNCYPPRELRPWDCIVEIEEVNS